MTSLAMILIAAPALLFVYAYVAYPLLLWMASRARPPAAAAAAEPATWPAITIVIPAYNAAPSLRRTLDHLLETDYPGPRQVLVVSDGSTDGTDDIVRRDYSARGVELHRVERRGGKAAAENAVAPLIRNEIVVNTDATIVVPRGSIRALVRGFADPRVGVVSGRDVSVSTTASESTKAEAGYSNYEMRVRSLEARFGWIVGATGSLYGLRRELFDPNLVPFLSRDFASTLHAYERGWRSVAADDAVCMVGQAPTLLAEYRRKARTMVLGLDTLWHYRRLLDPRRHGWFAIMMLSHKLCRWLVYLLAPLAAVGLLLLAPAYAAAAALVAAGALVALLGWLAIRWPASRRVPTALAICGFLVAAGAAGIVAWLRFFRGVHSTVWEPTKRRSD